MGSDFAFENEAYSREQFVLYAYKGKPYSKCPKILWRTLVPSFKMLLYIYLLEEPVLQV